MNPAASPVSNQRSPYRRAPDRRNPLRQRFSKRAARLSCVLQWLAVPPALARKIVGAEFGFTKSFTVENHADARSFVRNWNQPKPTINGTNQDRERAVNSFRTPHTIVMREDRELLKMIISLLEFELPSEHRGASAGIDEITRLDFALCGRDIALQWPSAQRADPTSLQDALLYDNVTSSALNITFETSVCSCTSAPDSAA